MNTSIKKEIKKLIKKTGSHYGVVKHQIESRFENVDFSAYEDFVKTELTKKHKNTETKIRANIRFQ